MFYRVIADRSFVPVTLALTRGELYLYSLEIYRVCKYELPTSIGIRKLSYYR